MFLEKVFSTPIRNNVQKTLLRVLSSVANTNRSTINDGILCSDSDDIVIPSSNLSQVVFERIAPFERYKAIVSKTY